MSDEFDFVIVGGGSAGCVLANRLSSDPAVRVCLIEAGSPQLHPMTYLPLGVIGAMHNKRLTWNYKTVPQQYANSRRIPVPAGRLLGGSSAINGMVYMRGHPRDFDDWANAGNHGWSYNEVLPYFLRSENNIVWRDSPFHGTSGELTVDDLRTTNPLSRAFVQAAESLQYPTCVDFNAAQPEGFGLRQVTQRKGVRVSAATAFLAPAKRRANLDVITRATADRIVLDRGRAVAVEIVIGNSIRRIAARREVIVSSGTIGSPMLLLRSGIGPQSALRSHGIEVLVDLPGVGANLQDHATAPVLATTESAESYGISWKSLPRLVKEAAEYVLFRRGLLSSNGIESGGFIKTSPDIDRPDIQFSFAAGFRSPDGKIGLGHGYGLATILLRPKSRGTVSLSKDDRHLPQIDLQLLSDPDDAKMLAKGLQIGRRILSAPAMLRYRGKEVLPGPAYTSLDELTDYVRGNCATAFHPVGTCKMGVDAAAVVDPQLRVRGVQGLRVVDASIIPSIIAGNTNAPVIMIAEKAVDLLLSRPALTPLNLEQIQSTRGHETYGQDSPLRGLGSPSA
jgi:choline dehydrogenase-like flavoprotein